MCFWWNTAIAAGIGALCGSAAVSQSPVLTAEVEDWQEIFAAGLTVYQTSGSSGSLSIACDVASTLDHSATRIDIQFPGGLLPPRSRVTFIVDGQTVTIPSDKSGGVGTSGCPECARKFVQLWPLLRAGNRVEVVASDGRRGSFPLSGTAALMPTEPCPVP
jgi:hypothetical protein